MTDMSDAAKVALGYAIIDVHRDRLVAERLAAEDTPIVDRRTPVEVGCTVCGDIVEGNGIGHSDTHGSVTIGRLRVTL